MAVDRVISRALMEQEVGVALQQAPAFCWILCPDFDALSLRVRMTAHNGDIYILEMFFGDYRELPPVIDFIEGITHEAGKAPVFPRGNDSFFHPNRLICAPFNRKAYKIPNQFQGPHADWPLGNWENSTAQNFPWVNFNSVAGILTMIQTRLDRPTCYLGPMK
jgi:hypothetical protein